MAKKKKRAETAKNILRQEDFKYLDQTGVVLPQLVLGIEIPYDRFGGEYPATDYKFKPGRTWLKIAHQTAGLACHQRLILGTLLTPISVAVAQGMAELEKKWLDSNAGLFGNSLDSILEYRADLKRLFGADCNGCHEGFEEAIYPVDIEFLPKLAADAWPKDLDELIEWESGWQRTIGCVGRWNLWILAQNSD